VLVSYRIPPFPRHISDKIMDLCCPPTPNNKLCDFVKSNPADEHCLIRTLLGKRRRHNATNTSRLQRFSLRNVQLHINQMEELGLDVRAYAETMAGALALMHWGAHVDANDVEFVLAPRISSSSPRFQSHVLGEHTLWILDFDLVRSMSMDAAGVKQACMAFFKNERFYPREARDRALWQVFKGRFADPSKRIIGDGEYAVLLGMLMQAIEEEGRLLVDSSIIAALAAYYYPFGALVAWRNRCPLVEIKLCSYSLKRCQDVGMGCT
jgi:hypothetical protein